MLFIQSSLGSGSAKVVDKKVPFYPGEILTYEGKWGVTPAGEVTLEALTINIFMQNPLMRIENLDPGVQKCAEAKTHCTSYRIEPSIVDSKQVGNVLLNLLTFKRHTVSTGWEFRGLIILVDNVVVYKDPAGGRPSIHTENLQNKPLGPLQDPVSVISATRVF